MSGEDDDDAVEMMIKERERVRTKTDTHLIFCDLGVEEPDRRSKKISVLYDVVISRTDVLEKKSAERVPGC